MQSMYLSHAALSCRWYPWQVALAWATRLWWMLTVPRHNSFTCLSGWSRGCEMMQIMQQKQNSNSQVKDRTNMTWTWTISNISNNFGHFQTQPVLNTILPYWYYAWSSGPSADFALLGHVFLANIGLKMSYWKYDGNTNIRYASMFVYSILYLYRFSGGSPFSMVIFFVCTFDWNCERVKCGCFLKRHLVSGGGRDDFSCLCLSHRWNVKIVRSRIAWTTLTAHILHVMP